MTEKELTGAYSIKTNTSVLMGNQKFMMYPVLNVVRFADIFTLCMLGNFLLTSADFLKKNQKCFQEQTLSEYGMVWIQIITEVLSVNVGCDLCPNCLQRLSADDKSCR